MDDAEAESQLPAVEVAGGCGVVGVWGSHGYSRCARVVSVLCVCVCVWGGGCLGKGRREECSLCELGRSGVTTASSRGGR
jgi:hypothetical protein